MAFTDTIFALASGAGRTGVAVFRVSGPDAAHTVTALTGRKPPKPRRAALRHLRQPDGAPLDEALVLFFKGPHSFTGEDTAEFQTHGSPAVTELMALALSAAGARPAEPGEFTRRAFENGRMDLTEAEGLADLIDAETTAQHTQALRQMQGGLKTVYEAWRHGITDALASVEGEIDFPDESDVPDALSHVAYAPLTRVIEDMDRALSTAERGERIRAGLNITIIGPPNAGKSTLINRLAGRDAVIVSDVAGTTRDVIDIHMVMAGLPVRVSDTAGLRETDDRIEAEGVRRATGRAGDSDIRIAVIDGSHPGDDRTWQTQLKPGDFLLVNKSDKGTFKAASVDGVETYLISAATGDGVDTFQDALDKAVADRFSVSRQAGLTRARHRDCALRARDALLRARDHLGFAPELAGDDMRLALHAIRELAGETDIEAVLDRIFSRFCIGK